MRIVSYGRISYPLGLRDSGRLLREVAFNLLLRISEQSKWE